MLLYLYIGIKRKRDVEQEKAIAQAAEEKRLREEKIAYLQIYKNKKQTNQTYKSNR